MEKYIRLFIVGILLAGCSVDELDEIQIPPTMTLDARLPMDSNGYYHLQLNPNTNQTIHRITGSVLNTTEPTKVSWESNLYWWLLEGETVANITITFISLITGELVYTNLPPLINWENALVPTINNTSYVTDDGEINTMIAPTYGMITDTLRVKATVNEWNIIQTLNIVLE
jgi:hypothetical protein